MPDQKLKVIPEPEAGTRSVLELTADNPLFIGSEDTNFLCGNCGKVLLKNMPPNPKMENLVIRCYSCGLFNDAP